MAKDKRSELSSAIKSIEEAMHGDNGESKEEREFNRAIEKALEQGRIPIECIDLIPVSEEMAMKVVVAKEC